MSIQYTALGFEPTTKTISWTSMLVHIVNGKRVNK